VDEEAAIGDEVDPNLR
jgi:hypothetical protein